jgi:hypothetical protein
MQPPQVPTVTAAINRAHGADRRLGMSVFAIGSRP